jgi:hypothetical protein
MGRISQAVATPDLADVWRFCSYRWNKVANRYFNLKARIRSL